MKEQIATSLEESIHILNVLNNIIHQHQHALYSLIEFNIDVNVVMSLNHMTFQYTTIQVASYLDEYHSYFALRLNEEQRAYIKPFYKRIRLEIDRFPDIKKFRNHISAHNLRAKNRSIALYEDLNDYQVPQNIIELSFLTACIDALTKVINRMFPNAYEKIGSFINLKHKSENTSTAKEPMEKEAKSLLIKLEYDLNQLQMSHR